MRLFVQIPCYNEEKTLPDVIASLPSAIDGLPKAGAGVAIRQTGSPVSASTQQTAWPPIPRLK